MLSFVRSEDLRFLLYAALTFTIQGLVTEMLKGGLPGDLATAPSPGAVLIRDRRLGLAVTLPAVLLGTAAGVLLVLPHLMSRHLWPALVIVAGLAGGLAGAGVGVGISGYVSAWPRWAYARAWFALQRRLPWRLMTFLADARQRGVLRQDGAVYQFRHIELQHWLAGRPQPRLAKVADKLAAGVHRQWQPQAHAGGAGGQRLLPLRWVAADPSLAGEWDDLVAAATSGAGRSAPHASDGWARSPQELAGEGNRLARSARPGADRQAGRARRARGRQDHADDRAGTGSARPPRQRGPGPGADHHGLDPARQDLREWLAGQLTAGYPALAWPAPAGTGGGPARATALLANELIIPVLDGLDDLPPAARGLAITKINDALPSCQRLVVTSRTTHWQQAVRPAHGTGSQLDAAAVIQLCPLDGGTAAQHLRARAGGPAAAGRWQPVIAALERPGPLAQALSSPLMIELALAACMPAPGTPDPARLCALTSREAIEHHLLDAFTAAACRPGPDRPARDRRRVRQGEKWLMLLARHLDDHIRSDRLAWWQLSRAAPAAHYGLAFPVTASVTAGIAFGLVSGPWRGLCVTLAGLAAGTLARREARATSGTEDKQPYSLPWWRYRTSPQATLRGARASALTVAAMIASMTAFGIAGTAVIGKREWYQISYCRACSGAWTAAGTG